MTAFGQGAIGWGVVLLLLIGWMGLRADETKTLLQSQMPSKAVLIESKAAASAAAQAPQEAQTPLNERLAEEIDGRLVPRADLTTGQTPFEFYRRPVTLLPGRSAVAVIFMNAGLAKTLTEKAITDLPEDITLAFSPYADVITMQAQAARESGKEIWLHLPLQNENYPNPDPGPATLLLNASLEQNASRLLDILSIMQGYPGLISYPDHAYTNVDPMVNPILRQVFGRGLGFVDGRIDRAFWGTPLALENQYPFAQVNVLIDPMEAPDMIEMKLKQAENLATKFGQAMIMTPLTPLTFAKVQNWTNTLENKSLQLVPVSALLKHND